MDTPTQSQAGGDNDGPLFADFSYPLRGDFEYIEAALSWYAGGPAGDDVKGAWERILLNYRDTRADYMRVLQEKADLIVAGEPPLTHAGKVDA